MNKGFFQIPIPSNEPVLNYDPGSPERAMLKKAIEEARSEQIDIPMYIGGDEVRSDVKVAIKPPHDLNHTLGYYHKGDKEHVNQAIKAALGAKEQWEKMSWEHRASIFLKAADLIAGPYRAKINAATMLCQSKNPYQAEIDSTCELVDFLRYNVYYMTQIYEQQPMVSPRFIWNRMEQRPLEGFIFAITPFNFTAIAGNLPTAPAMMGNTVIWKPANSQVYSARVIMEVLREAGLPDGVINLLYVDGKDAGDIIFNHQDFGGIHFTGSTEVFKSIWKTIGNNIQGYKSYPRIVGETGGKDFIIAHKTADVDALVPAIIRGSFEYQGQKCSAVSRVYIPGNLWDQVRERLVQEVPKIKMGGVEDFSNFMNAVIDEKAFDKIVSYIDDARNNDLVEILTGGNYDKTNGYFIEPTILVTKDPMYRCMCEEIFGPVLTIYVYHEERFEEALELLDTSTPYGLTGAVFAQERSAIDLASQKLINAAGNFYINDKPTGSVVGQQPFGGSRDSGTNDKAGSIINLMRWVSPRVIKENFVPPTDWRYSFMDEE